MKLLSIVIPLCAAAIIALISCQTSQGDRPRAPNTGTSTDASTSTSITYEGWIKGYLANKCTRCHGPVTGFGGGQAPDLTTFEQASMQLPRILVRIQDAVRPMPQGGPLPSKDVVANFTAWGKAGKPRGAVGGLPSNGSPTSGLPGSGTATGTGIATSPGTLPDPGLVSWDGWVSGWLQNYCTGCHQAEGVATPDLTSYEQTKLHVDQLLARIQNASNPMPPDGPLPPAADVARVKAWRDAGTPRSGGGSGSGSSTPVVEIGTTYEGWVRDWLSRNCTSCHAPGGSSSPDLTTYDSARFYAVRILARASGTDQRGQMPPNGQPPPTDELNRLRAWIEGGTLQR